VRRRGSGAQTLELHANLSYIKGMLVECAHQFRLYPTAEQAAFLNRTFGCVRFVYNRARAMREEAWKERHERCGFRETNAMLTALKKDPAVAWLNEVSSVPLQQTLCHLDCAYRNFFRKTARYPGFRSKRGRQTAEFTKSGFSYRNGTLTLAKMADPLKVIWSRPVPSAPSTVTVIREPDGRWYLSCRVQAMVVLAPETTQAVGIDLGLMHFATLSTGEKIANPRYLTKRQKRLARLQRRLAKKRKGSRNRGKARIKLARAHAAVRHARQDFLHKLTTRLIDENQTICVEDLAIKGMILAGLHSRAIADASWSEFLRQLAYKALWYGRTLVRIDRFWPSTKTCGACGTTGHVLTLADREWTCPDCGTTHDRDINAARNILAAGLAVSACGGDVRP
jgi:putative transposase